MSTKIYRYIRVLQEKLESVRPPADERPVAWHLVDSRTKDEWEKYFKYEAFKYKAECISKKSTPTYKPNGRDGLAETYTANRHKLDVCFNRRYRLNVSD